MEDIDFWCSFCGKKIAEKPHRVKFNRYRGSAKFPVVQWFHGECLDRKKAVKRRKVRNIDHPLPGNFNG